MARHSSLAALVLAASSAFGADVQLVGTFGDKAAILSIDGGEPRTVRIGQRSGAVTVIAVDKDRATIEVDGKRRTILRGQHYRSDPKADDRQRVVLAADPRGHFLAEGSVNGGAVQFLVDTGATSIALPGRDAVRLGIDYRKGQRGTTLTAGGPAAAWRVKLDRVRVGGIELSSVDAIVIEQGLETALLGMSFLNRVDMRRDGATLTLTRRF
jgi:aspartyl protease family protein